MYKKSNWFYISYSLFCNLYFLCESNPLIGPNIRQAGENEFPFVVSISFENFDDIPNNEEYHNCGGALISREHVLTSAHCMYKIDDLDDVVVEVGSNDLRKATHYKVKDWKPYNAWSGKKTHRNYTENDISIIKLKKKVDSNLPVAVITNAKNRSFFGKKATTVGWGRTSNGTNSRYLMATDLTILSEEKCMSNMKKAGVFREEEISPLIFLCTDSPTHVTLGRADSGGPLIINGNEIIGINDSVSPTHDVNPKEINIHIGVDDYRDEIKDQIKKKSIWPWD